MSAKSKEVNRGGHSYGLKSETLTPLETLGQSIANIAPTATPTIVIPLVFALSGGATWLAYLFATVSILLVAASINQFARRSASPGSFYSYAITGLGPFWGSVTGWALLIAYIGCASAVTSGVSNYTNVFLDSVFHFKVPAAILIALSVLIAWYIAYKDIKLSTRVSLALEFFSVSLIVLLVGVTLYRYGWKLDWAQLTLKGAGLDGLRGGLVLAIFSFVGFESAAALGSEAKNPLQSIPRAIVRSALIVGALFVVSSYAQVIGFYGNAETLDKSSAPLSVLADKAGLSSLGLLIDIGAIISFFACVLASINAGARVLFLMSRHGLFHSSAGDAHHKNETPHIAVTISSILAVIPAVILSINGTGDFDIYGWVGTIATLGFIVTYIIISIAAPVYLKRRGELKIQHLVISGLAVFTLGLAILGNLYPVPPAPYNILPYIFLGIWLAGVAWIAFIHKAQPNVVEDIREDSRAINARFGDGI
ncbi:MAG: APC family permease [Candidatus Omnitrophica bacterium]|nr:APC family permease [Candidatus Omnitrophota bacterium]